MMGDTSINWIQLSDIAIIKQIGSYIKHIRTQQNKTQAQLAEISGLNRWTISQIENGESITLASLVQILRALDSLHTLNTFEVVEEISPLAYAKLRKKEKHRVRNKPTNVSDNEDLEW